MNVQVKGHLHKGSVKRACEQILRMGSVEHPGKRTVIEGKCKTCV